MATASAGTIVLDPATVTTMIGQQTVRDAGTVRALSRFVGKSSRGGGTAGPINAVDFAE
ncbi:MAG TPA: hypothetical protein VEW25_11640 [Allosphingosinicella sp.]|nr:hypothetical protein [Allosphingosinicella sp.]